MIPQSRIGIVHFLVASWIAKKADFKTASSVGTYSGDIVPPIPEDMVPLFHDVNRVKLVKNLSF